MNLRDPNFTTYPIQVKLKSRRDEINIVRLRIGHVGLRQYLHKTNQAEDNKCDCGEEEDTEHFLLWCPLYELQRRALWLKIANLIRPFPTITEKLLLGLGDYKAKVNLEILRAVCKFIRETGRVQEL